MLFGIESESWRSTKRDRKLFGDLAREVAVSVAPVVLLESREGGKMGLPPNAKAHFSKQHMDDAAEKVAAVADKRLQESEENQRAYERFYNNLALFSGGTIALSLTYLGYLKSVSKIVLHPLWLVGSWLLLFLCLVCSVFYVFFVTRYGHFYGNREYCEAVKKRYETEIKEVGNLNVVNLQTESEIEAYAAPRREAARISGKNANWNERRETFYQFIWRWSGRLARLTFLAGFGLLLAFAIENM